MVGVLKTDHKYYFPYYYLWLVTFKVSVADHK